MDPESGDAGLGIMEVLVGSKHALENLESWNSDWGKRQKEILCRSGGERKAGLCAISGEVIGARFAVEFYF